VTSSKTLDKPNDCKWPMRHLPPNLYKMYSLGMAFAAKGKTSRGHEQFLFTAAVCPTVCNAYPCSRNNADKLIEELCNKDWWVKHEGGRDPHTGHLKPNWYEIVQHDEFVERHPGSCPPKEYVDDYETAEALGLRYGDKLDQRQSKVPLNFAKTVQLSPNDQRTADALAEWAAQLTDEDRKEVIAHWKMLAAMPLSPEQLVEKDRLRTLNREALDRIAEARKAIPAPTNAGVVHSHKRGNGPTPTNEGYPLPQTSDTHSHECGITTPTNVGGILEDSNLEEANLQQPTTTTRGGETPSPPKGPRQWLSWLWSYAEDSREERQGILNLRRARKQTEQESPDVTVIENMIQENGEPEVMLAWAEFCINFKHSKTTIFPVTVFESNFKQCQNAAVATYGIWKANKGASRHPPAAAAVLAYNHRDQG
jgi:hypothetical protein